MPFDLLPLAFFPVTFTHLHVHSRFSPQWGLHDPERLCAAVRELGMDSLALTDRNGLYGIPHFIACARTAGLKPVIGCELVHATGRALVWARGRSGYARLCQLVSARHEQADFDLVRALADRNGLIVASDVPALLERLAALDRRDLYVEISPGHRPEAALQLARRLRLPPLASCRAVLLEPEDHLLHRVLRAIAANTTLDRLSAEACARPDDCLWPPARLAARLPHCPEALANSREIAETCAVDWEYELQLPAPPGLAPEQAAAELERRARAGALRRYGRIDARIEARLQRELELIGQRGFAGYFLVVEEIARQSSRICGRGSAAASLVAYCLGITHVDPLRHNLFFERFLNEGRIDPPDIDIDFPWDERDAILDFVFARHGRDRTAMVANQIGFMGRGALREVAKVFGVPAAEIRTVTRRISGYWRGAQLLDAVREHPLFRGERLAHEWPTVLAIAARMRHQLRHLGLHCGGVVITPGPIRSTVPVQVSAKGPAVIQWEKDQAESAGLIKIDLLGNRSLAVIRDACRAIENHSGRRIDDADWYPLEDRATRALLCRGATMGCFYIESPATRLLLRRMFGPGGEDDLRPDDLFEHLVMASSIIRPAANAYINTFIDRMRGKPWRCLHPDLEPVLKETYGIAVYQEQITQMAMVLAGFDAFEGDQLRKIVSNKAGGTRLQAMRERFFQGGRDKGHSEALLKECWRQILSFGGYSFCKPHSASYVLVSARAAWLKAHYPAEFMAAVISNRGGFYSTEAYLSECRRLGLTILPPDVNASDWHFTGRGRRLRIGLMQVRGLPRQDAQALLAQRHRGGRFRSFDDLLERCALTREALLLLVRSGCCDSLAGPRGRRGLLWQVLAARRYDRKQAAQGELFAGAASLAAEATTPYRSAVRTQEVDVFDHAEEILGLHLGPHPLSRWRDRLADVGAICARDLDRHAGRQVRLGGWWVTGKTVQTRKGEPMQFITFEDETALFETTFFPDAYRRWCRLLGQRRPYLVEGRVEVSYGVPTLTISRLRFLDEGDCR
ncbi:MAG: DNA polymerase III subunit alpha [Geothermobacteraceae bacterium]